MTEGQKEMLKALERKFYPFLEAKGFQKDFDPDSGNRGIFPFFKRNGNTNYFLAIHFDRHREAFVLEVAEATVGASVKIGGNSVQVTRFNHVIRLRARLQAGKGMLSWFRYHRRFSGNTTYDKTADKVIALFGEVEEWWLNKTFGPHLRNEDAKREHPALLPMLRRLKNKIKKQLL